MMSAGDKFVPNFTPAKSRIVCDGISLLPRTEIEEITAEYAGVARIVVVTTGAAIGILRKMLVIQDFTFSFLSKARFINIPPICLHRHGADRIKPLIHHNRIKSLYVANTINNSTMARPIDMKA